MVEFDKECRLIFKLWGKLEYVFSNVVMMNLRVLEMFVIV